jgi:outer membrane protein OmpA-like peptidoglycan-associated protein
MKFKTNKMNKLIVVLPALMLSFSFLAQEGENLVKNHSFEDAQSRKLRRTGDIDRSEGWISPTGNSADLFSAEAKMPEVMTPDNVYGTEEPKDGLNYAGIITFSYREKENRTYITSKLKSPMKKGMRYKVEFYASLAELAKYSANKVGVHFSKKAPGTDDRVPALILETHVEHPKEAVFDGRFGWDKVCGEYTATGKERFITIGNFTSDNDVKNNRVRKERGIRGRQIIAAYYYIDDISVRLLGPNDVCECNYADEAKMKATTIYQRTPAITDEMSTSDIIGLYNIFYGYGRYDVKIDGDKKLNKIVELMKENPSIKIQLTGHSDVNEAKSDEDSDVSLKRAEYIRTIMVNKDIDASRFIIEDVKAEKPTELINETDDDKLKLAKNRRVTFSVI